MGYWQSVAFAFAWGAVVGSWATGAVYRHVRKNVNQNPVDTPRN